MVKNIQKQIAIVVLTIFLPFVMVAKEFRAPLVVTNHGYDFDPREKSLWHTTLDADWYSRSAHRAFGKHGVATNELSKLIFNESSFRMSHIFEDCLVMQNSQYYNPFMRIITIHPRVEYRETGAVLTAGFSRAVLGGKARIGMRLRAPVRAVDTIRIDNAGRRDSQTEDVARLQKNEITQDTYGVAYRLDFLEAIPQHDFSASQVNYAAGNSDPKFVSIFGGDATSKNAAAIYSPEGRAPQGTRVGVKIAAISNTNLPTTLDGLDETVIYQIGTGDYSKLSDTAVSNATERVSLQNKKASVWITSAHANSNGQISTDASEKIQSRIDDYLKSFNANTYEWLHDRGYDFESSRQVGLGDLDIELYYDQDFGDRIIGGVSALLRAPTACGSNADERSYVGNPYRSHTGNGQHVEVGGGLHFDVEARSWVMVHFDGEYRFALARAEKICATPAGSLIKNIGSEQLADVSWHSVVANADLHLCHPQTTDLTGFVGYQFYWKREDTIRFRDLSVESWLGKTYSTTTKDYTVENSIALDNALASANTEQFAHRIKGGLTYHLSDWCSLSLGGAVTFAGQNMPKEFDLHAGCRVVL